MKRTLPRIAYRVQTPRLVLRCLEPGDIPLRAEAVTASGTHLKDYFKEFTLEDHAVQVRQFRASFDGEGHRSYGVFEPGEQRFLGEAGLLTRAGIDALEIAYWFRSDATGRGLATEAASAMVKLAFAIEGVKRLDLNCAPDNQRSLAMARRLGFTLEARLRDRQLAAHHPRGDLMVHSLLASEYPSTPSASLDLKAWDFMGRPLLPT